MIAEREPPRISGAKRAPCSSMTSSRLPAFYLHWIVDMNFSFADEEDWQLHESILDPRRSALWDTPFDQIVERLVAETAILAMRRAQNSLKPPGYRRLAILIGAPSAVVDLFHNGRGGYRVQYLAGVAEGDAANAYAFGQVIERVMGLVGGRLGGSRARLLAGATEHGGKLWIKEGRWIRPARKQLIVPRWRERSPVEGVDATTARRLMVWGAAAPEHETRIVLKGEWIDDKGVPPVEPLKQSRGDRIHWYGFT